MTKNHGKWFRFMITLSLNFPWKETQTLTVSYARHVQMLLDNRPIDFGAYFVQHYLPNSPAKTEAFITSWDELSNFLLKSVLPTILSQLFALGSRFNALSKNCQKLVLAASCWYECLHGATRFTRDGFS